MSSYEQSRFDDDTDLTYHVEYKSKEPTAYPLMEVTVRHRPTGIAATSQGEGVSELALRAEAKAKLAVLLDHADE